MSLSLRQLTQARVDLGRAGNSLPTSELLEFRLAQARARDAVHVALDVQSLRAELREIGLESLAVASAARNRTEYLRRPDLGRKLNQESLGELESFRGQVGVAFVIADGLSALAVHRHAPPLLRLVAGELAAGGDSVAPVIIATQGRVAIGDEVGAALGAELSVVLIGERPGLSAPDSLGIYLTWQPKPGRTDAERNCISNIRAEGLSYEAAAFKLLFLVREARRLKLSGVNLRDSTAQLI
jgi:ethanolamine ammonia-lyase small subunit